MLEFTQLKTGIGLGQAGYFGTYWCIIEAQQHLSIF